MATTKALRRFTPYREWESLPVVLTLEEVCAVLRVCDKTARGLLQKGELKGRTVGGHWLVTRQALKDYLEGGADACTA